MGQWDGSKISDFWQQSRNFVWLPVFSNNCNTTEVPEKVFLSTSNVVKPLGGRGSARTPLGELTALSETPGCCRWSWLPPPKNPTPLFSVVTFDYAHSITVILCYASVIYSIWSWLADVERTMWGCGWSTDQTKTLSEAFLISDRVGLALTLNLPLVPLFLGLSWISRYKQRLT